MKIFFLSNLLMLLFISAAFSIDKEIILKKIEKLNLEEKKDLTNFFRICCCSSDFGYTIFGEKPMSLEGLFLDRPKFEDIDEYKDNEWVVCEYRMKEGWEVWTKHFQDVQLSGFSLIFYPVPSYPELLHFAIINHKMFVDVVEKNLNEFQKVLNRKISSKEILKEYIKGEGKVFEIVKNHDGLLGVLLGYGKENSFKYMKGEKLSYSIDLSTIKPSDMSEISLPSFKAVEGSFETRKIMESFKKQKERITPIYQKENFLEIVLLTLFCSD